MNLTVRQSDRLRGVVDVPGDKSITHRALLLAGISEGRSRIRGYLDSGDCRATIGCLTALGVDVQQSDANLIVTGRGLRGFREPDDALDCVRSGTTMRLLGGLVAGQLPYAVLSGAPQLRRRPMERIAEPLRLLGASVYGREGGRYPPLTILGGNLRGADYAPRVASAQVKSCILLAGLYANGQTIVREPGPSRDHTERMLRARGVPLTSKDLVHRVRGPVEHLPAMDVDVPADFSSAAYWIIAGLLVPGSQLMLRRVGVNPTRTGLLDVLRDMGANIAVENERDEAGEPVADIVASHGRLSPTEVHGDLVPRMIDEFPLLALVATQAEGVTRVRDAAELRVKETDRIATVVNGLRALGAHIDERADGFVVEGPTPLDGALVDAAGDHRLAMMLAVSGLIAREQTTISSGESIGDSYPGFLRTLDQLTPGTTRG